MDSCYSKNCKEWRIICVKKNKTKKTKPTTLEAKVGIDNAFFEYRSQQEVNVYCMPRLDYKQLSSWWESGWAEIQVSWPYDAESRATFGGWIKQNSDLWFLVLLCILGWLRNFLSFVERSSQVSVGGFLLETGKFHYSSETGGHSNYFMRWINMDNIIWASAWGDPKIMTIWVKKYKCKCTWGRDLIVT